jgi:hypothetical protein
MKKPIKRWLFIIALVLLAGIVGLVWIGLRANDPIAMEETVAENVSDQSGGPSFGVRVIVPRAGLPLGGILPDWIVEKQDLTPRELKFDHTSPGAKIGSVGPGRIELSADGWDLLIETDGEGRITPGTHLVFPLGLGGSRLRLNCRPADRPKGFLRTTTRAGSGELSGRFLVELVNCRKAESERAIDWPPSALTVRGSFVGLPTVRR